MDKSIYESIETEGIDFVEYLCTEDAFDVTVY